MAEQDWVPGEVQQAAGAALQVAITSATRAAESWSARRVERVRVAQAASDRERAQAARELRAERDAAMPLMRLVWSASWWKDAEVQDVAQVWGQTARWAGADDPYARATLERMRRQIERRYGITLPADAPSSAELGLLLAAPSPGASPVVGARPANASQGPEPDPGPELEPDPEADQVEQRDTVYRFVVREADAGNAVLAEGSLSAPAGAAGDVAVEGARDYARSGPLSAANPAERVAAFLRAGRGEPGPVRELKGLILEVYHPDDPQSPVVAVAGEGIEAQRAYLRAGRMAVIDGSMGAGAQQVRAALRLEERAGRGDLREARFAALAAMRALGDAEPGELTQAHERVGAAVRAVDEGEARLGELALRGRVLDAQARGQDGALVRSAAALREHLDAPWWASASPQEVAGVVGHVEGWSPGVGRDLALAQLRANLRARGVESGDLSPGQLVEALRRAGLARDRALPGDGAQATLAGKAAGEQAAAGAAARDAGALAAGGADASLVGGMAGHADAMNAAAAQDRDAAAALAGVADREAADAVALAAQGFLGTPSMRLREEMDNSRPPVRPPGAGRLTPGRGPDQGPDQPRVRGRRR